MADAKLREVKQWLLWTFDAHDQKRPCDRWGQFTGSTRSQDYITFAEAKEASERLLVQGPAFCFTREDPFVGIDIDNCMERWDTPKEWARPILDRFRGTYSEISPSLRGIKIYAIGSLPEGFSNESAVEDGRVEVYSHGRFFTFTELQVSGGTEATDQQEPLDWLFEHYWPKPARRTPVVSNGSPRECSNGVQQRAIDYVDAADLPAIGGRNSAAFRLAGHLFAMVDDTGGSRLDHGRVLDLVRTWNSRLAEPMDDVEVETVVEHAKTTGRARDAKPGEDLPVVEMAPGVDLSGIICPKPKPKKKPKPKVGFPLQLLKVGGFLGEMTDFILRTAIYPQPELAFGASLALLSAVTGRKVKDGFKGARTNIYVLGLAPSGSGKEHPRQVIKQTLIDAGWPELSGPERIGSSAGLVSKVADQPATLFLLDEIGRYLQTTKSNKSPHLFNVPTILMTLYSSAGTIWQGDAYADLKRNQIIDRPHAVVYGTATPETLWDGLTSDNVAEGLVGRMIVLESDYVPFQMPISEPTPQAVLDHILWWKAFNPGGGNLAPQTHEVPYSEDALQRLTEHMQGIGERLPRDRDTDVNRAPIWARVAERTAKLALLFACSRNPDGGLEIRLQDVDSGILLSNYLARRLIDAMSTHLADNQHEKDLLKVLEKVRDSGKIDRSSLTRKTQWLKRRDRDEILSQLIEQGDIVAYRTISKTISGENRETTWYEG